MDRQFESIAQEALALDEPHRGELAEMLIESLPVEERFTEEWLEEAERRREDWNAGLVEGISSDEAMRQLRKITS